MSFNYRFSVIPAGAIIDARLTPRALQVLCLLGRHTNDAGWCSRSQVKMARELSCGRSTVYDALELLYECQWVERKANGRGGRAPVEGEQPFAAYSYRVVLDRDNLPQAVTPDDVSQAQPTAEGAVQAAGGAGIAAGGAAQAAPLEGNSSEGISSEPESERERARAHEKRASGLAAFEARWPTAAADDRTKTAYAWEALSEVEREQALSGIGPFLEDLKRLKRAHPPTGWKYLEQKRWQLLPVKDAPTGAGAAAHPPHSPSGRALLTLGRVARYTLFRLSSGDVSFVGEVTPRLLALSQAPPEQEWQSYERGSQNFAAWREMIGHVFSGCALPALGVMSAPWPFPPRKDGTINTGPPISEPCSDQEAKAFTG